MKKSSVDLLKEYRAIVEESNIKDTIFNDVMRRFEFQYPKIFWSYNYDDVENVVRELVLSFGNRPENSDKTVGYAEIGILVREAIKKLQNSNINESYDDSPVFRAIMRRLEYSYPDVFT